MNTTTSDPHKAEKLLSIARDVLTVEAQALTNVATAIQPSFIFAVQEIGNMLQNGKLIVSGMGKAGFIAMKTSATFASIGLPSFYLHPAEAIHGDLGRFMKSDVVLVMSNSGETPEVLRILPHLKTVGCSLISITADDSSTLASQSDVAICYGKHQEAQPLGVAPTVSTTIMLALGDALAMAVANWKGISQDDFARLHPGGSLGKSLTLVSKIMRQGDQHCIVDQSMLVRDVIQKMMATSGRPGAVTVVDSEGTLSGILTDGDVRRCLSKGATFLEKPVCEFMGTSPKTVNGDRLVEEALRIMREFAFDELIVVDNRDLPIGQIDIQDIVALQTS